MLFNSYFSHPVHHSKKQLYCSLLDDILVWTIASPELGLDVGVLEHGHAGVLLLLLLGVEPLLLLVVRGAALAKVVVQAARQME